MRKRADEVEPGDVLSGFVFNRHIHEVGTNSGGKVILRYANHERGYPAFSLICSPDDTFALVGRKEG